MGEPGPGRDVVGDDEVESLALELSGGVLEQVLGLRGEADERLVLDRGAQIDEEVVGLLEFDRGDRSPVFLIL